MGACHHHGNKHLSSELALKASTTALWSWLLEIVSTCNKTKWRTECNTLPALSTANTQTFYCVPNICVLPDFICCNSNPEGSILTGCAFMNGISDPIKETPESSFTPSMTCEDTERRQPSMNQEAGPYQNRPYWHPDLQLPASRTVRNKFLFL